MLWFMTAEIPAPGPPLTAVTRPSTNPDNAALKYGCSNAEKGARGPWSVRVRTRGTASRLTVRDGTAARARPELSRSGRAAAASHAWPRSARARSSRASSTSRRSAGAASACAVSHASVAVQRRRRRPAAPGTGPCTTSMPIWIDRSAHTRSIASKYCAAYGASSSRCDGCAKPAIVASTSALDSASDSTTCRPRLRLDRRRRPGGQAAHLVALAGRRVVAGQFGRDAPPRRPPRARPAAPGTPSAAPGPRPARRSSPCRPAAPAAAARSAVRRRPTAAKNRAHASWCSLPGSASRSSAQRALGEQPAALLAPLGRRVVRRARTRAHACSICSTPMSVSRPANRSTRSMKSRAGISASRVRFHSADQHSARASGSVMSPRCARSVASEPSSKRILQYVRSSSLTRTRSGRSAPGQLRDDRPRPVDVHLGARVPHQRAVRRRAGTGRPPPGAAAARGATRRPPGRTASSVIRPSASYSHLRGQGVDPGRLQPGPRPGAPCPGRRSPPAPTAGRPGACCRTRAA